MTPELKNISAHECLGFYGAESAGFPPLFGFQRILTKNHRFSANFDKKSHAVVLSTIT